MDQFISNIKTDNTITTVAMSAITMRLREEKERLRGLSDQEIIKEFLALGKEFSELQVQLRQASEEDARRKRVKVLTQETLLEESDEDMEEDEDQADLSEEEFKIKNLEIKLVNMSQENSTPSEEQYDDDEADSSPEIKSKPASPSFQFDDPSVPQGWGTKMIPNGVNKGDRKIFKSPCGRIFYSRRSAKQFMTCPSQNYSQSDIDLMESKFAKKLVEQAPKADEKRNGSADALIIENTDSENIKTRTDFSYDDPTVPKGWGIKLRSNGTKKGVRLAPRKNFCDPNGLVFLSGREAYEHMMKAKEYGENDLEMMKKHHMMSAPMRALEIKREKDMRQQKSIFMKGFSYTNASLPEGWGLKTAPFGQFICNPEGKVFKSRQEAYEDMVASGTSYSDEDKELVRTSLESVEAGTYSQEDLAIMKSPHYSKENDKLEIINRKVISNQEVIHKQVPATVKRVITDFMKLEGYNYEDESLPANWGSKPVYHKGQLNQKFIANPEGKLFSSRALAYDEMLLYRSKYEEADIDLLKKHLRHRDIERIEQKFNDKNVSDEKGKAPVTGDIPKNPKMNESSDWLPHELIPGDWKYSFVFKSDLGRKNGYKRLFRFKSDTGQVMRSAWALLQHLKQDTRYSRTDVDNLIDFVKNNKKQERELNDSTDIEENDNILDNLNELRKAVKHRKETLNGDSMLREECDIVDEIIGGDQEAEMETEDVEELADVTVEVEEVTDVIREDEQSESDSSKIFEEPQAVSATEQAKEETKKEEGVKRGYGDKYQPSETSTKTGDKYQPSEYLPDGWLLATYHLAKGGNLLRFKSSTGAKFDSVKKILKYMEEKGYSKDEIERASCLGKMGRKKMMEKVNIKKEITEEKEDSNETVDDESMYNEFDDSVPKDISLSDESSVEESLKVDPDTSLQEDIDQLDKSIKDFKEEIL